MYSKRNNYEIKINNKQCILNLCGGDGAEIVYALRNDDTLSKMILDNIEETGQNIRKWYQRKLPSDPNKDYYYIIRNTSPAESILVEYAFLDSTKDDRKQIKNDWDKWAEAVVKAVADYKGYNYVAPGENTVNNTYTVQKGDSLWSIAKRFNVGINEIKNANNLTSSLISVGQQLIIPGAAPSDQTNVTYVVQKGDSLWSIANANNTTVDEIANLNDLGSNMIYVGQILQIPNSGNNTVIPDTNLTYNVQSGDTLYSIALKYNTTPVAIMRKNNLTNNLLTVGQTLIIPNDIESTGNNQEQTDTENTYIVQKGDSLYSISRKFGITIDALKNNNNIVDNTLIVGQVLKIPAQNENTSNLYVVKKGDNLWSIAQKYGVTVNAIRILNNLTSDVLKIGQTLIIP